MSSSGLWLLISMPALPRTNGEMNSSAPIRYTTPAVMATAAADRSSAVIDWQRWTFKADCGGWAISQMSLYPSPSRNASAVMPRLAPR
jgi:hypothetical protein